MKRILLILVLFSTTIALSQEKYFETEVQKIAKKIELITKTQKDSLKVKVLAIDKQLEIGEISKEEADKQKKTAATYHATQIENKVSEQERLLQVLVQEKTNGKIASVEDDSFSNNEVNSFSIGNKTFRFNFNTDSDKNDSFSNKRKNRDDTPKQSRKTTSQFVFALGTNNVLENNQLSSLNDSEYQFWKSRFYELGWSWKTRFTDDASHLYFKYGFSFLWNNLRLEGNRVHVKNGEFTDIEDFEDPLTESRLRHVQMTFPVFLEWDFSENKKYDNGFVKDRTHRGLRIGVGAFGGFKLGTRQYLEFRDANGIDFEQIQYDNFNMNIINYGISSYISYRTMGLYVKYDLNPLFQDTETRNISMGLRFDFN
ncbi:hypothetical protein N9V96_01930 [Polaribacter sp.]|nr:hypothetical protein [Polaribacter sp.]